MGAILGGLFNSRLNMKLREEKGYTYGAGAGFDLRRAAGPFAARAAVNTEVTVPAVADFLAELDRIREAPCRRFGAPGRPRLPRRRLPAPLRDAGPVVGALSGLVVHDLPDDELARYRPAIEAVTVEDVLAVARDRGSSPSSAAIVLVGDADAFGADLEAAGFGPVTVERDSGPIEDGRDAGAAAAVGPVDAGPAGPDGGRRGTDDPKARRDPVEPGMPRARTTTTAEPEFRARGELSSCPGCRHRRAISGARVTGLSTVHPRRVRREHRQLDAGDRPGLARPRADRLAVAARR